MKLVKQGHRLPRGMVDPLSLGTSKVRIDRALSKLTWLKISLLIAGDWTR